MLRICCNFHRNISVGLHSDGEQTQIDYVTLINFLNSNEHKHARHSFCFTHFHEFPLILFHSGHFCYWFSYKYVSHCLFPFVLELQTLKIHNRFKRCRMYNIHIMHFSYFCSYALHSAYTKQSNAKSYENLFASIFNSSTFSREYFAIILII